MSKLGKKIIERLTAFVEETEAGRFISLVPNGCHLEIVQFGLPDLKLLVQHLEYLEEQDVLEMLREQG